MTEQTLKLIDSLPQFADLFRRADPKGSARWEIVRWSDIDPETISPEDVTSVRAESDAPEALRRIFTYRTEALRASADWVRTNVKGHSELGHWGVWTWRENGIRKFQSVRPLFNGRRTESHPTNAGGERGARSEVVFVSVEAYDLLRHLADEDGATIQATLEQAIRELDRQRYFAKADAAYRKLRGNQEAWEHEVSERAEIEGTLLDDIEPVDVMSPVSVLENRERQHA